MSVLPAPPNIGGKADSEPEPTELSRFSSSTQPQLLEGLALQMNRMQQMQDWLLLQKEQELAQLRVKYDEQTQEWSRLAVQNALLQEKLQQDIDFRE